MPFSNFDSASFPPEALAVIYAAFDMAWTEIADRYGDDPHRIAATRNTLAQAVLLAAEADATDPVQLKTAALEAFAAIGRAKE